MATTYDDLIAYGPLATYTANRETVAEMPKLVRRAQDYITARLDHDLFAEDDINLSLGDDGLVHSTALPEGFLEIRHFMVRTATGGFFPILPRPETMLEALYPADRQGQPRYYARLRHMTYKVFPRPWQAIPVRLRANVAPAALSPAVQTNILTERFPGTFEVALLREAALFNLDMPQVELHTKTLLDMLGASNRQISRLTRDESAQRPTETRNVEGS